ncbi:MFS family permease [Actinokineospora baliensis]|uniref:MFS transporter n=1 Tax=Actinokineospora baliensis TaxID=547056 RepID=UPI00195A5600|nr:MFS transporter [Actinokineospora baliensis]MBM7776031.1 MFS family permease [Actinokineospora baliensis]
MTADQTPAAVQRRAVAGLFASQLVGGVGLGIGIAVGVLFAARLVGPSQAGLAGSAMVVGSALLAPVGAALMRTRGRRVGLAAGYLVGAVGAALLTTTAATGWVALLYPAMFCFGGATTSNFQARFAATDLADRAGRGRALSTVVWATTVGAVTGPAISAAVDSLFRGWHAAVMVGPFVLSGLTFLTAALIVLVVLRPDPLLLARELGLAGDRPAVGIRAALRTLRTRPPARLGLLAVVTGHLVMVSLMSMTPVHLDHGSLGVVGLVMSTHLAGMFGLSPLVGWLGDRFGRRPLLAAGAAGLLAACLLAAAVPHDPALLTVALGLLGLSWSATLIGGSTLLTESLPAEVRPAAQGLTDLLMGLAGTAGTAVAGIVLAQAGYPALALSCAAAVVVLTTTAIVHTS